ncbi:MULTISPECIES: FxSxx-COOH cyclophane-containing RiPP peptide [Streptomyces]|uniref:FxSxx-COOH cyclophane-containing RiPP peptide n=1 Tax=Streptomyces TaxID=1883 RepID=UPI0013701BB3|nr:FxSxx-COOH cyclophane-containing RiPP peptide [Streptomyces sp. SID2888]MYV45679.1 FXSXX-COOH protein [Streptomyces sp. SID2888]
MGVPDGAPFGAPDGQTAEERTQEPLPDLLELDLGELRTVEHPVLREVLEELRDRAARPSEMLWGFNSSL